MKQKFLLLNLEEVDSIQWLECFSKIPDEKKDIHYLPGYARIYSEAFGQDLMLAWLETDRGAVAQVFVKRNLNDEPFLRGTPTPPSFDLTNPYGFGGPLFAGVRASETAEVYEQFRSALEEECAGQRIAAEFSILHPLLENHLELEFLSDHLIYLKDVVVVDLTQDEEALFGDLNRGCRSNIKKAQKLNVQTESLAPTKSNLDEFNAIYFETMSRQNASAKWLFPSDYFSLCVECLGDKHVSLFRAKVRNETAAMQMVLSGFGKAYYHFGGSRPDYSDFRPSNLLMWDVILGLKKRGNAVFHLGGGVTSGADDPLMRYKSGFSSLKKPLFGLGQVLNQAVYDELTQAKKHHEAQAPGSERDENFFPFYRR